MNLAEPGHVTAYTDTGVMFPCAVVFDCMQTAAIEHLGGVTTERFRKYRVVCEIPWQNVNVIRFDIAGWPDDVTFAFDLPGMTEDEARHWMTFRQIRELPYRAAT
jgi:hypothetical protein